jgi:hypothetical protein
MFRKIHLVPAVSAVRIGKQDTLIIRGSEVSGGGATRGNTLYPTMNTKERKVRFPAIF